jgi:hypothetical protein
VFEAGQIKVRSTWTACCNPPAVSACSAVQLTWRIALNVVWTDDTGSCLIYRYEYVHALDGTQLRPGPLPRRPASR